MTREERINELATRIATEINAVRNEIVVYDDTAIQAEVDLNTAKVSFIEAPSDGNEYVRKDANWAIASGGSSTVSSLPVLRLRSTAGQNADATTDIAVQWNVSELKDSGFTHDTVINNSRIEVDTTGNYNILGAISYTGTTANYRFTSEVSIRVNGTTTLSSTFKGGYIRATSGANFNQTPFLLNLNLTAGDYIEILTKKINTTTGNATVDTNTNVSMTLLQGATGEQGPVGPASVSVSEEETSTAYTLTLTDQSKYKRMNNSSAITVTIPTNASVAFPIDTEIEIEQTGTGVVTVAGSGVTINTFDGLSSNGQYWVMSLKKTGTDIWTLIGGVS